MGLGQNRLNFKSQVSLLLSVDHDLVKHQFSYLKDGEKNGENNLFFPHLSDKKTDASLSHGQPIVRD